MSGNAALLWNGLDGLINSKPFMPTASPRQQAVALMELAERDGECLCRPCHRGFRGTGDCKSVRPDGLGTGQRRSMGSASVFECRYFYRNTHGSARVWHP